jgi:ABC-type transporter Mla subunit MlaD
MMPPLNLKRRIRTGSLPWWRVVSLQGAIPAVSGRGWARSLSDWNLTNSRWKNAARSPAFLISDSSARRSGETLDKFGGTAESITQLADALGEDSKRLAEQADATLASLRSTAATLNTTVANADDDVEATLTAIRDSAENFQRLAANLEGFVSENREPLAEFSNQGLFEVTTFFNQARELVNNINRLLLQVERDPTSFFLGNGQQGYEPATKK